MMKIVEIKKILDSKFNIRKLPPDEPFGQMLPEIYNKANIEFRRYLTKDFLDNFHGLMIKNSSTVKKVYLIVFLSREILNKIFARNEKDILIFSHHPMEMETSNRGFLPLPEKYFQQMQTRNISVYILHSPLDINKEISTSGSIANLLQLRNQKRYSPYLIGYAGICGELPQKISFGDFIVKLRKLFNLKDIHFVKKFNNVQKIGIIAGGGANPKHIKETIDLGCDTYLTGDYINKINSKYGRQQKREFEELKLRLNINLIECSHYLTEKMVLVNEMMNLFKRWDVTVEFVEQDNPWY